MSERDGGRASQEGERLYQQFHERVIAGEELDFEVFCAAHPQAAEELRGIHQVLDRIRHVLPANRHADDTGTTERERSLSDAAPFNPELLDRLVERRANFRRYDLQDEIARGSQGSVVRVWDEDLRRALAMKVLVGKPANETPREAQLTDSRALGRFLEEAQVTGQLDHPGVVPVHELGLDDSGRVYFTMKLVRGNTLRSVLDLLARGEGGWTRASVLRVLLKVCEAMAYAHHKGVVHRDLKPANVMVGRFGEVYVMDWGLAKVLGRQDAKDLRIMPDATSEFATERRELTSTDPDSPLVTMDGDVIGTPAYMPPEQAMGLMDDVGPRSDVYAVGAILYHLLAGHMPYVPPGSRAGNRAVWRWVQEGPPRALQDIDAALPGELVAICERAMSREPAQRYADMSELAADLAAYEEGRVVKAFEQGAWAEGKKWVLRNKALAAALLAAVTLPMVGLVLALHFKGRSDEYARKADDNATRAEALATFARENAVRAAENELFAREQERLAKQSANDLFSLSAAHDLDDLVGRTDMLWPAHPALAGEYESWLDDARTLLEGRAADPARGREARPGLEEHRARLAELRARPSVPVEEWRHETARQHRLYPELERLRTEASWHRRMLGKEPWPDAQGVEQRLLTEPLPPTGRAMGDRAWSLVAPGCEPGGEVEALVLAERAFAAARPRYRAWERVTLAWAYVRLGRFDEALAEGARVLDEEHSSEYGSYLDLLEREVERWEAVDAREAELLALERRQLDLEFAVGERRLADDEDAWWQARLSELVVGLETLGDPETGLAHGGVAAPHGWSVKQRLEFARTIEERSITGPEAKARWAEAVAAIERSPLYGGLVIKPQMGLLPLGADPRTGLWEFAHLQTGEPAVQRVGRFIITEDTGLVFVLIPGGKFWMGAQSKTPAGRNFDPRARAHESPEHEVELSPYFISKYEMTQGQWERVTGLRPSFFSPGWMDVLNVIDLRHPVEQVSWTECTKVLKRLGLALPSEAQWERAARGGSETPWWTGREPEGMRGPANIADQSTVRAGYQTLELTWPDHRDGWAATAPVATYAPNGFGLHEVVGNVWEWCQDGFDLAFYARSPATNPIAPWERRETRVVRGGSWKSGVDNLRSATRSERPADSIQDELGLRPVRALDGR